jgi:acetyl esterase/lipase
MAFDNGYVLISIDYRLAPETKLPAIIEDVEDAFRWLRSEGKKLFRIDPDRIAVAGGSAGGYLTLTTGFRVKPRPRVLVAFWGYGDLVGDWYSKPSPHPRHHRVKLTRDEAWKQVNGPPVSDSRLREGNGGAFYQFCRQHGNWPKAVSNWDPITQSPKFAPFMPIKNVDAKYPPTVLIHGTVDTDVPYEQSTMMARELKQQGVEYELLSIEGGEHGLAGGDPKKNRCSISARVRIPLSSFEELISFGVTRRGKKNTRSPDPVN